MASSRARSRRPPMPGPTSPSSRPPTWARSRSDNRGPAPSSSARRGRRGSRSGGQPMIVEGQVHGGLARASRQALYEEGGLRRRGTASPHSGGNLVPVGGRSAVPTSKDTDREPGGQQRWRQASARPVRSPSTPAVVNAIADALRPPGHHRREMPCTRSGVEGIQGGPGGGRAGQRGPSSTHARP